MAMTTTMTTTEKNLYQDASVVGAPAVSQGDPDEGREGQSPRGALMRKKMINQFAAQYRALKARDSQSTVNREERLGCRQGVVAGRAKQE